MRANSFRTCVATALTVGVLAWPGSASAVTVLTNFDNYSLAGTPYGSWAAATLTAGPTSYNVQAQNGFGGRWNDMDPNIDATGETDIELTVTVNQSDPNLGLGVVLALVDEDGTEWVYQINSGLPETSWFGLLPSVDSYVLTNPIDNYSWEQNPGLVGGMDLSNLTGFHLQVDTGGNLQPYDLSFEHFQLVGAPVVLEGDLDDDGFVGISDLNLVLGDWNKNVPPADPRADPSGDDYVGIEDLNAVLGNWNAGTPPSAGSAVPEPAGLMLLGAGALASMKRRG